MANTHPVMGFIKYLWGLGFNGWHTENDANLVGLGIVTQLSVLSRTVTAQPGAPANGDRYIIPAGATGAQWAGNDGKVAAYIDNTWTFYTPVKGWQAFVHDLNERVEWNGSNWAGLTINGGTITGTISGSPTITGQWAFGNVTSFTGISPQLVFIETDAAVDNQIWDVITFSEGLRVRCHTNLGVATEAFVIERTDGVPDVVSFPSGSVVVGAPTGGPQGSGTVNSQAVYDDGVLLTDYVFDAAIDGDINITAWDDAVPDRIRVLQRSLPEKIESRTVTVKRNVPVLQWEADRLIRKFVEKDVPVRDKVPVFNEDGNQIGLTEIERVEQILIPAQEEVTEVEERTHEPARRFKANLDELDPEQFAVKWKAARKLPAFTRGSEKKSLGECSQAIIETLEVQAVHIEKLLQRIKALEASGGVTPAARK